MERKREKPNGSGKGTREKQSLYSTLSVFLFFFFFSFFFFLFFFFFTGFIRRVKSHEEYDEKGSRVSAALITVVVRLCETRWDNTRDTI